MREKSPFGKHQQERHLQLLGCTPLDSEGAIRVPSGTQGSRSVLGIRGMVSEHPRLSSSSADADNRKLTNPGCLRNSAR